MRAEFNKFRLTVNIGVLISFIIWVQIISVISYHALLSVSFDQNWCSEPLYPLYIQLYTLIKQPGTAAKPAELLQANHLFTFQAHK